MPAAAESHVPAPRRAADPAGAAHAALLRTVPRRLGRRPLRHQPSLPPAPPVGSSRRRAAAPVGLGPRASTSVRALIGLVAAARRGRRRLVARRPVPPTAARDHRHCPGDLRHQPAPAARPRRPDDELTELGPPSTTCSDGSKPPSRPSATSSPTPRTSCAPPSPAQRTLLQVALADPDATAEIWRPPAKKPFSSAISKNGSSTPPHPGHQRARHRTLGALRSRPDHRRRPRRPPTRSGAPSIRRHEPRRPPTAGDPVLVETLSRTSSTTPCATTSPAETSRSPRFRAGASHHHREQHRTDRRRRRVERLFQPFQQIGAERVRHTTDTASAWPSSKPSPKPTAPTSPHTHAPQAAWMSRSAPRPWRVEERDRSY